MATRQLTKSTVQNRTTKNKMQEGKEKSRIFSIDYYPTPKAQALLEEITKHTGGTVEQHLLRCFGREIEMNMSEPEVMAHSLLKPACDNDIDTRQVAKDGRRRITLSKRVPAHQHDVLTIMQTLVQKYRPLFFQQCIEDGVRADLEVLDQIPDDTRSRLEAEWKKEIGW